MGRIMVLEYHLIGEPEGVYQRTPANFRHDLQRLWEGGYYPINLIDLATGQMNVPAGKTPVVLTFDDSDIQQFHYLEDGSIDPDSAVGMLVAFHQAHPDDWPLRATFFVLLEVDKPERILFGQKELAQRKLQELVSWGMEVGSHTVYHANLAKETPERIRWNLAESKRRIEALIPGYTVRSLSVPFGAYPADASLLMSGEYQGIKYHYDAVVQVSGGPSYSPYDPSFNPYFIKRTIATEQEINYWFGYFAKHPETRFVSDGDPARITAP
jgi:peptidoglycan/xylan/chitin deacetylase (PgdA/CDA1 family)